MLVANENTHKKKNRALALHTSHLSIQHIPPTPKTVLRALSQFQQILFSEQTWCSTQLLCCILVSKSISFWYLQCGLLTKMLHVGVRTLTSSCFGFACARAQGTRHRRRRQVPCPLSKKIGRNRLQEFKHSFNQKNWPGVTNNQSSVSSAD